MFKDLDNVVDSIVREIDGHLNYIKKGVISKLSEVTECKPEPTTPNITIDCKPPKCDMYSMVPNITIECDAPTNPEPTTTPHVLTFLRKDGSSCGGELSKVNNLSKENYKHLKDILDSLGYEYSNGVVVLGEEDEKCLGLCVGINLGQSN